MGHTSKKDPGEREDGQTSSEDFSSRTDSKSTGQRPSVDNRMESFKFVFGDRIPKDIWDRITKLPPGKRKDLIARSFAEGFLALHDERKDNDKFVVYLKDDIPKHFGKISGDRVESKWGRGPIWKHVLWEVPLTYGDTVKYSTGKMDYSVLRKIIKRLETRSRKR
ncbi:MAG: hypothetical protein ACE5JA_07220 [bacterium]